MEFDDQPPHPPMPVTVYAPPPRLEQRPASAQWWNGRRGHLLRAAVIGSLILLLQIPVAMIAGLVGERQMRRDEATAEIAQKWGARQRVLGPWVVVPYRHTVSETDAQGYPRAVERTDYATFLPHELDVDGQLDVETRYRGIFELPVYRSRLRFSGVFERPAVEGLVPAEASVQWEQAHLVVLASDVRTLHGTVSTAWNGDGLAFEPGAGPSEPNQAGIHAPLGGRLQSERFEFDFELALDGSGSLALAPVGDRTDIELASSWSKPSFQGAWLPSERSIADDGFSARWDLGALGRGYAGHWTSLDPARALVDASVIEVALLAPIDHYRMSERSVKYELLFLVLVFTTVWLFEIRTRVRVHPIQYLLVGFALCTFYLLELALSEHIGFAAAYAVAATMVVAMLGMYGASVLRAGWRGISLAGASGALYGYLYVVLMNEDYALLAGALAVFGALATVMALTHRIDWYAGVPGTGTTPGVPRSPRPPGSPGWQADGHHGGPARP